MQFLIYNFYIISSLNGSIKDVPHLKSLILGWKRGASFGNKPSQNTGSGGSSGIPQVNRILLETFGSEGSADGVTVI